MPATLESIQATCEARTISQMKDISDLGDRMNAVENKVDSMRLEFSVQVAVLKTQVGMYAAGGAVIGGAIVGVIITAVERFLFASP